MAMRKAVKNCFDMEALHKKREEESLSIRKQKREESLQKRRNMDSTIPGLDGPDAVASAASLPPVGIAAAAAPAAAAAGSVTHFGDFHSLLNALLSGDAKKQLEATTQIRRLLSIDRNPPIDGVITSGILPRLIQFLGANDNPKLQFEAAWAITNVASGESHHTQALIDQGAVGPLIALLLAPGLDLREQAVWALGNIAGDGAKCRDYVLTMGVLGNLLSLIHQCVTNAAATPASLIRNAAWTLSNLFRGKPAPVLEQVSIALPTVGALLSHMDREVVVDVLWAVSYATDGGDERVAAVLASGIFSKVVEYLSASDPTVQMPALRATGNVLTGSHEHTQAILEMNTLPRLVALLGSSKRTLRKETCWALSNIAAGTPVQIQRLLESSAIPLVREIVKSGDFDVKKEAAWVLANACSCGTPDQVKELVSRHDVVRPLCDLLISQDNKLVKTLLDALQNILNVGSTMTGETGRNPYADMVEEAEGLTKVEDLQNHQNSQVYERAVRIIEDFFDGAADEDNYAEADTSMTQADTSVSAPAASAAAGGAPQSFTFGAPQLPTGGFYFN